MDTQPYIYTPLITSQHRIRLIQFDPPTGSDSTKVQLRIASFALEEVAGDLYHALSYTWGPPLPKHRIWLNDRYLDLAENVVRFLRFVNQPQNKNLSTRLFWIDSICINQNDVQEKNSQVGQMGEVYRHAAQVLIWLGGTSECVTLDQSPSSLPILRELATIRPYADGSAIWGGQEPFWLTSRASVHELRPLLEHLVMILRHEYWFRLWIVQEICFSKSALVIAGTKLIYWENLISVRTWLKEFERIRSPSDILDVCQDLDWQKTYETSIVLSSLTEVRRLYDDEHRIKLHNTREMFRGLLHLVSMFGRHSCQDSRDHVFGLLALSGESRILVDYGQSPQLLLVTILGLREQLKADVLRPVLTDLMHALKVDSQSYQKFAEHASPRLRNFQYAARVTTLCYLEPCEEEVYKAATHYGAYQYFSSGTASLSYYREVIHDSLGTEGYILAKIGCLRPLVNEPHRVPFLLLYMTDNNRIKVLHLAMHSFVDEHKAQLQEKFLPKHSAHWIESQLNILYEQDELGLQSPPPPHSSMRSPPQAMPLLLPVSDAMYIVEQ